MQKKKREKVQKSLVFKHLKTTANKSEVMMMKQRLMKVGGVGECLPCAVLLVAWMVLVETVGGKAVGESAGGRAEVWRKQRQRCRG